MIVRVMAAGLYDVRPPRTRAPASPRPDPCGTVPAGVLMTRSWLAAVLVMPLALGIVPSHCHVGAGCADACRPMDPEPRAEPVPARGRIQRGLDGPPDSAGDSTPGGSQGGAPGGGGRTSFPVSRVSREDSMRNALLTTEARDPAAVLVITETATEVVITPDKGVARTFHPTGREEALQLGEVTAIAASTREAGRLVVRYKVNQGRNSATPIRASPARRSSSSRCSSSSAARARSSSACTNPSGRPWRPRRGGSRPGSRARAGDHLRPGSAPGGRAGIGRSKRRPGLRSFAGCPVQGTDHARGRGRRPWHAGLRPAACGRRPSNRRS